MSEANGTVKSPKVPAAKPASNSAPKKPGKEGRRAARRSLVKVGPPKTVTLNHGELTFDRRLQQRKALYDDAPGGVVDQYAEALKEGAVLPPIKAVREVVKEDGKKDRVVYWVYDGFQRGAATTKAKLKSMAVEVVDGTYADAFILSLSANSDHGLRRSIDDQRRAVLNFLAEPVAVERVLSPLKAGMGGVHRAIAEVCGVSSGTVENAFIEFGVMPRGNKLVARPAEKAKKTRKKAAPPPPDESLTPPPPPAKKEEPTEKQRKAVNDAAYAELLRANFIDRARELGQRVKRIAALMASMLQDAERGPAVAELLKDAKVPMQKEFHVRMNTKGFAPYLEALEHWEVAAKLGELSRQLVKLATPKPIEEGGGKEAEPEPAKG